MSKRSKILIMFMMMSFVLVLAGISQLQAAEKVICPVTGEEFEKTETTTSFEYKGETYYFCCPGCKEKFVKNPEKYINKEGEEVHQHSEEGTHGEHQENGKAIDPVCGMEVEKEGAKHTYEYKGKTYYFCMAGCKDKFAENPEEYLKDADEQVTCPVSGETIAKSDAFASMEYKGKTYYFCCAGCQDKFKADPAKYVKDNGSNGLEFAGQEKEEACCSTKKK
jgi:Cu+-exporting ATPase